MNLARVQYITDSFEHAKAACENGIEWIQIRIKKGTDDEVRSVISKVINECRSFGVTCIVNDRIQLALELGADGVHLGKEDMQLADAVKLIGDRKFILGATSNSIEDITEIIKHRVTYIGLGPLRFTTTKEKLSPVLGVDGYKKVISAFSSLPPVYAIGGVVTEDVKALLDAGVYGVAVSGAITNSIDKRELITEMNEEFKLNSNEQRR